MRLSKKEAVEKIDKLIEDYLAQLPDGLSEDEKEGFSLKIDGVLNVGKRHIDVVYDRIGRVLNEDLMGINMDQDVQFYRESVWGLQRHIEAGDKWIELARQLVGVQKGDYRDRAYGRIMACPADSSTQIQEHI